jgi:hypothetical protein
VSGSQLLLLGGTPQVASDPNFEYTTLLLPGNGTNGAQNNTFLDSSTNNFTITRNGNTTQGTFSPFSQTGWGNYFDGNADYLTVANNVALQMSGDFTWEAWVYPLSLPGGANFKTFWAQRASGTTGSTIGGPLVVFDSAGSLLLFIANAASNAWSVSGFDTGLDVSLNQWQHIALVKSGTTVTLYKNGTGGTSTTHSTAVGTSGSLSIMAGAADGAQVVDGYMSNFRVVKGTAVYTANFTPPTTPLTAITNTSLLTCQSNRFIDNSTNNFTITRNGDVSVQAFSPFNPTAAWSASTNGGSGYFDGSGDSLRVSSGVTNQFTPGSAFTFEGWFYLNNSSASQVIFSVCGSTYDWNGSTGVLFQLYLVSGTLYWQSNGNGSAVSLSGTCPSLGNWHHIAVGYNGTTTRVWVDGASFVSGTPGYHVPTYSNILLGGDLSSANNYNGFMSNLRFVKGTDVYGASNTTITVPTTPLTAITNTSLLTNYTNAGIYDATSKNDLETVGNAQISTTQSKFGGSSMAFDGTGDWLTNPYSQNINFGTGSFTIEGWFRLSSFVNQYYVLGGTWTTGTSDEWLIQIENNGNIRFLTTAGTSFYSASITTNTWYHFAAVRNGSTVTLYINGSSVGSYSNSNSIGSSSKILYIGVQNGSTWAWNGFMQDLRITKGVARYTANFTAPTAAFPLL